MSRAPTTRTPRCRRIGAESFRSRPILPNASANCSTTARLERAAGSGARLAVAAAGYFPRARRARAAGGDLSARQQALYGLLSVRGPARASDARHAADAAAGARPRPSARLRRQRICAGDLVARRHVVHDRQGSSISTRCSTRTCLATISRPGWPKSALMKRTFRNCALISGLIERRFPGEEKSGRQMLFSTDLIYDVLRKHQPDHVLLRGARADAATGLLDVRRLGQMLARIQGRIIHRELEHVSPLAVPVMLEIGRESVYGEACDELLGGSRRGTGQGGDENGTLQLDAAPSARPVRASTSFSGRTWMAGTTAMTSSRPFARDVAGVPCSPISPARCSGKAEPAGGLRSASGKRLELRRPRRDAAALRYGRDAEPARGGDRAA